MISVRLIISAVLITITSTSSPFLSFERCPGATVTNYSETIEQQFGASIDLQSETEIGDHGHFSGFVPNSYNLELTFVNETDYHGFVRIGVKAVRLTDRLMFNIGRRTPTIDLDSVSVRRRFRRGSADAIAVCVANIITLISQEILVITFNRRLSIGTYLSVEFARFDSRVFDNRSTNDDGGGGAKGLMTSSDDKSQAVFTLFRPRAARTVFPCMDHPAFRATFKLCMFVEREFVAVSNTRREKSEFPATSAHIQHCFERTPNIPTYEFAFVLLRNYARMESSDSKYSVFLPASRLGNFSWIMSDVRRAKNYMLAATNYSLLPLEETTFYIANLPGVSGAGSAGLIGLDLTSMEQGSQSSMLSTSSMYRHTVHQWIENRLSIQNWNDACVQEGLATYLSWNILAQLTDGIRSLIRIFYRLYIQQDYDYSAHGAPITDEELSDCSKHAPLIMHMLGDRLGVEEPIEKFVWQLIRNYPGGNVGLNDYDKTAAKIVDDPSKIRGFLNHWFQHGGPVTLEIRTVNGSVTILQRISEKIKFNPYVAVNVIVSNKRKPYRLTYANEPSVGLASYPAPQWHLVDIDSQTLTRKVYESDLYLKIFNGSARESDLHRQMTDRRLQDFTEDFCLAMMTNLLPMNHDLDKNTWRKILGFVRNRARFFSECNCCATPSVEWIGICRDTAHKCNATKLVQLVR